ncbi:hypothetical protein JW905_09680 [bacterium]|nr:hypothetical protein [candidate division CSSED10-310 bacterium]
MSSRGFWATVLICAVLVFVGWNLVMLENQADRFMARVKNEVLNTFDPVMGPDSMQGPVMEIARQMGIDLDERDIACAYGNPDEISRSSAITAMGMESMGDLVVVEVSFSLKRSFLSRNFKRRVDRPMEDPTRGTGVNPGFPVGVDLPVPARGVQSYRDSVKKAAGGGY